MNLGLNYKMVKTNIFWENRNCYEDGKYYCSLLPKYDLNNLSDLEYLNYYLENNLKDKINNSLEFAAGTGRATKVLQAYSSNITIIEINPFMLKSFELKIDDKIVIINDDMNNFIKKNSLRKYDLIFSFWGPYLDGNSNGMLFEKLSSGTKGIFFHADRGKFEQKLIRKVLNKYKDKKYNPNKNTSEKEDFFIQKLEEYKKLNIIDFSIEEVTGQARFKSLDLAIETFLNFHLANLFDKDTYFKVYDFLENILRDNMNPSGEININSGMKIFNLIKL